jgi:hypothetical protein
MLDLLGLGDSYVHDGRVLVGQLVGSAVPEALRTQTARRLGDVYKQLNAPFGDFSQATLVMSTAAIKSDTADDARYTSIEGQITALTDRRDVLAAKIRGALDGAAFAGQDLSEQKAKVWIIQAERLIAQAKALARAS